MPALSTEAIAALTALAGVIGGYVMRIYTARQQYSLQTQLSERDLLNHLLTLQRQVVELTTQNQQLLAEVSRLRTQISQLQAVIDDLKGTKRHYPRARREQQDEQKKSAG